MDQRTYTTRTTLPHSERRKRRALMAEMAKEKGIEGTAQHFGVTSQTVKNAVKEFGVKRVAPSSSHRTHVVATSSLRIVALLQEGKAQADVANELQCSRQYVSEVFTAAVKNGVQFPRGNN